MKKTYKYRLPKNMGVKDTNVRIENGQIIVDVEFGEKFNPKNGNFCISDTGLIFIFKHQLFGTASSYIGLGANNKINENLNYDIDNGRFATIEEISEFILRLEKECQKRWNAETKQLEDIRWRAEEGKIFYYIDNEGNNILTGREDYGFFSAMRHTANNYFKTEEAAQRVADQIKEILKNSKAE